jgi:radical SAM superfamily enzyme YgiQ (UPF0313 family)
MKALFVNPYITDFTAYDLWLRPLGLLYTAAAVAAYTDVEIYWLDALDRFQQDTPPTSRPDGRGKFQRQIIDKPGIYGSIPRHYARYGLPLDVFRQRLGEIPPVDFIFVTSLMTYWLDGLNFTLSLLKQRFPRAPVVLGGILPSLMPNVIKENVPADFYIGGYGEEAILTFLARQGAAVRPHPDLADINRIPYPAFRFLGSQAFLPLLTSRGCPFHCTYCASNLLNPRFRERTASGILEEIRYMVDRYGTRHFILFDDALLVNKKDRFFKVFRQLREELRVQFHTPNGLHAREIDRQTAEILYQSGFATLRLSFESTQPGILSRSSDKVSVRQMEAAVDNLERAGYKRRDLACYLLFGLPGQTVKDIEEALYFVRDLGIVPHLAYYSPVPGTPDFLDLQKQGILSTPPNPYETNKIYYLYQKSGLSHADIQHIKDLTAHITHPLHPQ